MRFNEEFIALLATILGSILTSILWIAAYKILEVLSR